MKTKLIVIALLLGFVTMGVAQEFNPIPFSPELKKLPDGWHKFQFQGNLFDVEITNGRLVQGNIKWFDGATYSGSLTGTEIGGKGTYTFPDGSKYEGSFRKHLRHGKGSQIDADGTKWSGKWKADKKNGKGKVFSPTGDILKEGVWTNGEMIASKGK